MARPLRKAIDTFISITGASEVIMLQKLEEHDGVMNSAINVHFGEIDKVNMNQGVACHEDFVNIDDPLENEPPRSSLPLFPSSRDMNPYPLLDSTFGLSSNLFDGKGASGFPMHGPRVSHPREVREGPIEFKDDNREVGTSGIGPRIEDITGNKTTNCLEIHSTVIINDEDEDNADHEEEMVRAAIEASKREVEQHDLEIHHKSPAQDDIDLARAVSLS